MIDTQNIILNSSYTLHENLNKINLKSVLLAVIRFHLLHH